MLQTIGLHPVKFLVEEERSSFSICDRLISAVAAIFSSVIAFFENAMGRLVDPNWRAFVVTSRGHFDPRGDENDCTEAFQNALKLLKSSPHKNDPMKMFLASQEQRCVRAVYSRAGPNGTCFGNCVAMAYNILEAKRVVTISELRDIEAAKEFVKMAQALQFLGEICAIYNKSGVSHRRISMLDALNKFQVLPQKKLSKSYSMDICEFKEKMLANEIVNNPSFCGGAIIAGAGNESSGGHAMLLEINHESQLYILYDNNRGFYEWHDFSGFLSEIEKRLSSEYNFSFCNIMFFGSNESLFHYNV